MYAKIIENQTPGGKREKLGKKIPLDTPYSIQVFPFYGCNFKCGYCLNSLPREQHNFISSQNKMSLEMFKKCVDSMKDFPNKIKMIRFAGMGEPLLHPQIAEMISYVKTCNVCEAVHIVTNGALLTKELSLKLIDAKLDMLRISIQGLTAKRYKEVADVDIDFEKYLENIRFFFENRGNTKVYIKIIDCALNSNDEKQQFFNLFGDMCDLISIEYMTPNVEAIDYSKLAGGKSLERTQNGSGLFRSDICSLPFYMMQINPDGNVVPCCTTSLPIVWGNVSTESIAEIWKSQKANHFRKDMLTGVNNCGPICSACTQYHYGLFPEDMLDAYVDKLLPVYTKLEMDDKNDF
jgi:radical SAM protein with 4Fe4S-binding SPASM domain